MPGASLFYAHSLSPDLKLGVGVFGNYGYFNVKRGECENVCPPYKKMQLHRSKNLVTDPEGALQGAASGVSSLFNRAKETIGRRETTDAEDSKKAPPIANFLSKSLYRQMRSQR